MTTLLVVWSGPTQAFLASLAACLLLTPVVIAVAQRGGLLDVANARSSHTGTIPRGGGIAVMTAAVGTTIVMADRSDGAVALLAGSIVLAAVGLADDRFGLPALPRLAVQLAVPALAAAAVGASAAGVVVTVLIAAVWCAGYVNAFNFMDGINGISGTQAAVAGVFLALLARDAGAAATEIAAWALTGAAIGFLPFNAVRPRIFLGDVGSYGIGFWLGWSVVLLWDAGASALVLVGPFLMYLGDTSTVLIRRHRRGESVLEAHREHAYQRLNQAGWSHLAVTSLCAAVSAATAASMFLVRDRSVAIQLAALAFAVLVVAGYLEFAGRRYEAKVGTA